jgi:hypothetical protein
MPDHLDRPACGQGSTSGYVGQAICGRQADGKVKVLVSRFARAHLQRCGQHLLSHLMSLIIVRLIGGLSTAAKARAVL